MARWVGFRHSLPLSANMRRLVAVSLCLVVVGIVAVDDIVQADKKQGAINPESGEYSKKEAAASYPENNGGISLHLIKEKPKHEAKEHSSDDQEYVESKISQNEIEESVWNTQEHSFNSTKFGERKIPKPEMVESVLEAQELSFNNTEYDEKETSQYETGESLHGPQEHSVDFSEYDERNMSQSGIGNVVNEADNHTIVYSEYNEIESSQIGMGESMNETLKPLANNTGYFEEESTLSELGESIPKAQEENVTELESSHFAGNAVNGSLQGQEEASDGSNQGEGEVENEEETIPSDGKDETDQKETNVNGR